MSESGNVDFNTYQIMKKKKTTYVCELKKPINGSLS